MMLGECVVQARASLLGHLLEEGRVSQRWVETFLNLFLDCFWILQTKVQEAIIYIYLCLPI